MMIFGVLVLLFRSFFKPVGHPGRPAAGHRRRLHRPLHLQPVAVDPLADRPPDADGPGGEELDPLVEYAIEREREGLSQREALLEACRERPGRSS
jgi:HAE1 family hydrophobic/amphiphilic exporter-1